jgi:hypothetical protein
MDEEARREAKKSAELAIDAATIAKAIFIELGWREAAGFAGLALDEAQRALDCEQCQVLPFPKARAYKSAQGRAS